MKIGKRLKENVRRKLRAKSGMTMMLALTIFLMTATFSMVMIASALAAASNAKDTSREEQAFLAVSSASKLLQKEITSGSVSLSGGVYTPSVPGDPILGGVAELLRQVDSSSPSPSVSLVISTTDESDEEIMCGNNGIRVLLEPDGTTYGFKATVYTEDLGDPGNAVYVNPAVITFKSNPTTSITSGTITWTVTEVTK